MEPLLASRISSHSKSSPNGEVFLCATTETSKKVKPSIDFGSSQTRSGDSSNEYISLQRRIFIMTFALTVLSVLLTIVFFDLYSAISILLGAFAGILYLRLLAKSIGSLGSTSNSVSKFQLLVPVLLVLVVVKLPELQLLPAMLGFLLYKPSLIIQFLIKPYA